MRSSEGLQRYKINEMRALKGTDGPVSQPRAVSAAAPLALFAARQLPGLRRGRGPRIGAAKACASHRLSSSRSALCLVPTHGGPSPDPLPRPPQASCPCCCLSVLPTLAGIGSWTPRLIRFYVTPLFGEADGILSWRTDTCSHLRGGSSAVGERRGTRSCLLTPALPNEAEGIVGRGKTVQW